MPLLNPLIRSFAKCLGNLRPRHLTIPSQEEDKVSVKLEESWERTFTSVGYILVFLCTGFVCLLLLWSHYKVSTVVKTTSSNNKQEEEATKEEKTCSETMNPLKPVPNEVIAIRPIINNGCSNSQQTDDTSDSAVAGMHIDDSSKDSTSSDNKHNGRDRCPFISKNKLQIYKDKKDDGSIRHINGGFISQMDDSSDSAIAGMQIDASSRNSIIDNKDPVGCPFMSKNKIQNYEEKNIDRPYTSSSIDCNRLSAADCDNLSSSNSTSSSSSEDDDESMTSEDLQFLNDFGSCPFFAGAGRNLSLMKEMTNNQSTWLEYEQSSDKVVHIKYSYTNVNPDFPTQITENELFDHNNTCDGYFSRRYGFLLPDYDEALDALIKKRGRIWVTVGKRMNGLMANNNLIKVVDELEIVEGDERGCPNQSLQIACSILGQLILGYRASCRRNNVKFEAPASLQVPWTQICRRLGRRDVYYAVEDIFYNCRPIRGKSYDADNIEVMTPIWASSAESVMFRLFCASNYHLANMLDAILALARNEWEAKYIHIIIRETSELIKMMGKAIPDGSGGEDSIDPVEFATAFSNAMAPIKDGVPALSGGGCPIFVILDHIIGRQEWGSVMGSDVLTQLEWMPKNWRRFVEFLRQRRLFENVPDDLRYLWALLKDVYIGERGWLGRHKYRAYQFIELSGVLGRTSNKGSSNGEYTVKMLETSRSERDPSFTSDRSSYRLCLFKGKIVSVSSVSEDRLTKLVTIESSKPLFFDLGDHVAIMMTNNDDNIWRFSVEHDLPLKTQLLIEDGTLTKDWKERLDFDKMEYTVYNVLHCAKLSKFSCVDGSPLTLSNLCRSLVPEEPRLYSFATIHPGSKENGRWVTKFDLLVTRTGPGGCSAFLFDSVGQELSFGLKKASKFSVPTDVDKPVVVIAAGSGLGTYLPLLINDEVQNAKYAFLAFRTEDTVPYLHTHFREAVGFNKLKLFVELSREEKTLCTSGRKMKTRKTNRRYIDALMKEQASMLRELAAPIEEGGMEAAFYVCGNNNFFSTVRSCMDLIQPGMVAGLVESNRLHLEVQARGMNVGKNSLKSIKLAEMCFHNKLNDFWAAIHGKVYNFTSYLPWHPGGRKILHYIAGTDCTEQFDLASHSVDRMVYSQLAAYEVGSYEKSDDPFNEFLEFITRTGNCVNLYKEEDDLFDNLCDSYGKVQSMLESVFGVDFVKLSFQLEQPVRERVLARIWYVKHGLERQIADRMYKVAPMKDAKEQTNLLSGADKQALRHANIEERSKLKHRLSRASESFFLWCKQAVADFVLSSDKGNQRLSRMFFRLVMSFETFYSSLAQPLPVDSVQKWDAIRNEVLLRKTFLFRFPDRSAEIDKDFISLAASVPNQDEQDLYMNTILRFWSVKNCVNSRDNHGRSTHIINDWFEFDDKLALFNKLDRDGDGLLSQADFVDLDKKFKLQPEEKEFIEDFKKISLFEELMSYTFIDFLEAIPEVAERNKILRVSSFLFKLV